MSARRLLATLIAVPLLVAGCDEDGDDSAATANTAATSSSVTAPPSSPPATSTSVATQAWRPPDTINCTTVYRPTTNSAEQETNVVSVRRTTSLLGDRAELALGPFTFSVTYSGDVPEGEQVLVTLRQTADPNGPVSQSYYTSATQMATGAHGFTGLQRFEVDGSEVQWWCEGT